MIRFVESKQPDFDFVAKTLRFSRDSNQWTNFGPVSRRLETEIASLLELPGDSRVVACSSGTAGLHALVSLYGFLAGRPLRWIVSAFSFPCQKQGPLADSLVVDCASDGFLDRQAVESTPDSDFDGLIVTNLFGGTADAGDWTDFARERGKRLIFDSASSFFSAPGRTPPNRSGDGEAFSFHHTKPCGVGEGGCVVVPAEHEDTVRSLINFGRYAGIDTGPFSMNGKLSDVAAAFILDRLRSAARIRDIHRRQWRRIVDEALKLGFEVLGDPDPGFPSLAAILAPEAVGAATLDVEVVKLAKLYKPLVDGAATARDLFDRVVCWPCHSEMAGLSSQGIEKVLKTILRKP